jgi:hypothetical protein
MRIRTRECCCRICSSRRECRRARTCAALATYVVAEASDGYRVIFSIGEIDPDVHDSEIIVADSINGAVAMGANLGPLRLVVPHDKRPARWVRMLQSLTVVKVPKG